MTVTDTFEGRVALAYRIFAKSGRRSAIFSESQTIADAANSM